MLSRTQIFSILSAHSHWRKKIIKVKLIVSTRSSEVVLYLGYIQDIMDDKRNSDGVQSKRTGKVFLSTIWM